jgi:hypothetical protein
MKGSLDFQAALDVQMLVPDYDEFANITAYLWLYVTCLPTLR